MLPLVSWKRHQSVFNDTMASSGMKTGAFSLLLQDTFTYFFKSYIINMHAVKIQKIHTMALTMILLVEVTEGLN